MLEPLCDGRFVLNCLFGGKPCRFLIDTGAERSRIGNAIIRGLKLCKGYEGNSYFFYGEMKAAGQFMKSPDFFLEDENFNLEVVNAPFIKCGKEPISGLIGIDYLSKIPFTLDNRNNDSRGCLNGTLGITFNQELHVEIDGKDMPFIHAEIDGDENVLLLDTGANCSSLQYEKEAWGAEPLNEPIGRPIPCEQEEIRITPNPIPVIFTNSIHSAARFCISRNERQLLGMNAFKNHAIHYNGRANYYIAN